MPDRRLEKAHPPKTAAFAARGEDQMIDHRHVDALAGPCQRSRRAAIGRARGGVTAWVIVGKDDPSTAQSRGIRNDRAHRQRHVGFAAVVAAEMNAAGPVVEMRHPQLLGSLSAVIEAGCKKSLRGRVSGKDRGRSGAFDFHADKLGTPIATAQFNHVRFGEDRTTDRGWTRASRQLE